MLQGDIWKVARDAVRDPPPQTRATEHVRLVYRGDTLVPAARQRERVAQHALDLLLGVDHRIYRRSAALVVALADFAGPPIVQPAGKLTHHQQIHAAQDRALDGGCAEQRRKRAHRAEIGEQRQLLAQAKQRVLWLRLGIRTADACAADRAEEHGVAPLAEPHGLVADRL